MATLVNTRDIILQAYTPRYVDPGYQGQIDTINSTLSNIANDGILTPNEKQALRKEWDTVIADHQSNTANSRYVLSTTYPLSDAEWDIYVTAFETLGTYLNNGTTYTIPARPTIPTPPDWLTDAHLSSNQSITPSTFRNNWMDMYLKRSFFDNKAALEAGKFANWTGVSGIPAQALSNIMFDLGRDRSFPTVANESDYYPASNTSTGYVYRAWVGWKQLYINSTNLADKKGFVIGKTYRVYIRAAKLGSPANAMIGIYNETVPGYPFGNQDILSQLSTSYTTIYLGTLVPNWNDTHFVKLYLADGATGNGSSTGTNAFLVDWIYFQPVNAEEGATLGATWNTNLIGRPAMFRVVSRGQSSTTHPVESALYNAETGAVLVSPVQRSYMLVKLWRSSGAIAHYQYYDAFDGGAVAPHRIADLVTDLNAAASDQIVVVFTFDEPRGNRLTGGLPAALYRCGASQAVFGSPLFRYRCAYILVGIGGCGEGNGYEAYQGSIDSDTNAWCDVSFYLQNGNLVISGTTATPRTLADYSYTGDYNATYGAVAGTNIYNSSLVVLGDNDVVNQQGLWSAYQAWSFTNSAGGWTGSGATIDVYANYVIIVSSGGDPEFVSPVLNINGGTNYRVRARVSRVAGSGWDGTIYYQTPGHSRNGSYYKSIPNTVPSNGNWTILEWDMSQLTAGGTDWTANTITGIWIDLGINSSDQFAVDWVAIGAPSMASYGAVWGNNIENKPADTLLLNNILDNSFWKVGTAVTATGWSANPPGASSTGSNSFETGYGPDGNSGIFWKAVAGTYHENGSGGWNNAPFNVDITKTYRCTVAIVLTTGASGSAWFGPVGYTVCDLNTTNVNGNPYFSSNFASGLEKWYLFVGYIFPYGSTGNGNGGAGVYDMATGALVSGGNNFNWANVTGSGIRAMQFYSNSGSVQWFDKPLVEVVDGSEVSLSSLLAVGSLSSRNKLTSSNTYSYMSAGAVSNLLQTPYTSSDLYNGSAVYYYNDVYKDGPSFTIDNTNNRVLATVSGYVGYFLNTTSPRMARASFRLELYNIGGSSIADYSGDFGGDFKLIESTSTDSIVPCSGAIVFDSVAAGSYKVRVRFGVVIIQNDGSASTCMTQSIYLGEISAALLKV
jgi:hypothetical protein